MISVGVHPLQLTSCDWVMDGGDRTAHYVGWHIYRNEPWQSPPGRIASYQYPDGTSVVYTDSIPLVAIPLKVISPLLPEEFQYQGLWVLGCFVTQGLFGWLLLRRHVRDLFLIRVGTVFFLISPALYVRSGGHESLCAHSLLVAALLLYGSTDRRHFHWRWTLLILAASLVHAYLLLMILAVWCAFLVKETMRDGRSHRGALIAHSLGTPIALIGVMWVAGYFIIPSDVVPPSAFGQHSMNLSALFNSWPTSHAFLLPSLPMVSPLQWEGFNYLGAGVLALLPAVLILGFRPPFAGFNRRHIPLAICATILTLVAVSHVVTYHSRVLFTIPLPESWLAVLSIFRSSGRLFWITYYLVLLVTIIVLNRTLPRRSARWLAGVALLIQLIDLHPQFLVLNRHRTEWENPLPSPTWHLLAEQYPHIVQMPVSDVRYLPFSHLAGHTGQTINVGYTARADHIGRTAYGRQMHLDYFRGEIQQDALCVIRDHGNGHWLIADSDDNALRGMIDGVPIIAPNYTGPTPNDLEPWPFTIHHDAEPLTPAAIIERHDTEAHAVILSMDATVAERTLPESALSLLATRGSDVDALQSATHWAAIFVEGELIAEDFCAADSLQMTAQVGSSTITVNSETGTVGQILIDGWDCHPKQPGLDIVAFDMETREVRGWTFVSGEIATPF